MHDDDALIFSVHIDILGIDPGEVTRVLGVEPDEQCRKGEPSPLPPRADGELRRRSFHEWRIGGRSRDPALGIGGLLDPLVARLAPVRERFAQLEGDYNVFCRIMIRMSAASGAPSFCVSPDAMRFLSSIGAWIDADLYDADPPASERPDYPIE
ncbi:MAG: DUF4279 domain-containing protein [Alphaproteobacteria bacterium]